MKNIPLLTVLLVLSVALAGCGNKGALVKPSDIPVAAPAATPAETAPAAGADATPVPVSEPASGTPAARR